MRNRSDEELDGLDLAAVDLACAVGLPDSERLDIAACLAWIEHSAAWVEHETIASDDRLRWLQETYEKSGGIFRIVAMINVLWRGLGVRYNQDQLRDA